MSAVTVKKPYGCGDKGPPEPISPAASHCSCSSDLPGCCGEDVYYYPKQYNFLLIRCFTTALRGSSLLPTTELACPGAYIFVCSATPPADNSIEQCTLNDSVIKHAHHVTADIEPEPSQEEEMALAPPVHCFYVGRPLQFIIQYHHQVFAGLNSLYLPSINAD